MKTENALSPIEREARRLPVPVRSQFETESEYMQARRNAGLDCYNCGEMIVVPERKQITLCTSCAMLESPPKWHNHRSIRCPSCLRSDGVIPYIGDGAPGGFITWLTNRTGILGWECVCGEKFNVTVELEYTFISPELNNAETASPNQETSRHCY